MRAKRTSAKPGQQLRMKLKARPTHGGKRKNAGRRSATGLSPVSRECRPDLGTQHPVHVNWRVLPEVWNLRSWRSFRPILRAFAASCDRFGVRVTHFSVMGNHVHLIAEADGKGALTIAMQALAIRLAKGLNKLIGRRGAVFADRYHARPLGSPTQVRNAIAYVMNNARIHAERNGRTGPRGRDEYAVGPEVLTAARTLWRRLLPGSPPVAPAQGWLLREGWLRARTPVAR